MQNNQNQLQINITPEQAKGSYANLMNVTRTPEEFVLDFFLVVPPTGSLVSRIVMSPGHLKRTIKVLQEQLNLHEKENGSVSESQAPQKPTYGFGSH